ncbi:uncharacterized protein Z519_04581 [Cladophialophora bantiana CBS 173.52]|uniref:Uncharacterized protein n=1 Tax=Cladophialophora bantiana (strain ATCC 10958 / CBS 173.52 / CDC B-1940 / NIH 8579) TaxID=1442370 RepID=A0A0D2HUS6_CLAB1|nr:uncharacterized protein Z519_04581 [Cladophialophora bantiana CBS 173.52]KIW94605.1 hypothetical protein Z519_04581 [Cladophialophora bantiana CBS 173.52]
MGGSVFSADGLYTPRMPPKVYESVLSRTQELLRAHFKLVGHALEAPAKTSHGDIDIIVAEPMDRTVTSEHRVGDFLAKLLGAEKWKKMAGNSTCSLALRWPKEFEDQFVTEGDLSGGSHGGELGEGELDGHLSDQEERTKTPMKENANPSQTAPDRAATSSTTIYPSTSSSLPTPLNPISKHIQLDITITPTPAYFHWHMFLRAHGDFWQMLGMIVRRFGLTPASKGLCLRIAEVEKHNKEQARVLMTSDPDTVLDYLGLDKERYWRMFGSLDEMMDYLSSCRFHDPGRWRDRTKHVEEGEEAETTEGSVTSRALLKANDRQRVAKRPVFAYWFETYLPAHIDDPPGKSALLTREDVVEDAKKSFGADFATRFEERKRKMVRQIQVDMLWAQIRKNLPIEGPEIGYVMKGMKREIVGKREEQPPGLEKLKGTDEVRMAYQAGRFDEVLEWAAAKWSEVGQRQKKLEQENSRVHLLEKVKRDGQQEKGRKKATQKEVAAG